MFYYLYEITNQVNGKIYVGVHKTKSLDDGYMGSGKVIQRAIQKHGADNFTKVVLEHFDNAESMYAREKEVVTDEFLEREDTYNLRCGGFGGFDHINKNGLNFKGFSSAAERNKSISPMNGPRANIIRDLAKLEQRRLLADSQWRLEWINKVKEGKLRSDFDFSDTKKMNTSEAILKKKNTFKEIDHQQGRSNSQYGTMWITDEVESKKIKNSESIPEGWRKGRVLKV